MKKEDFIKLGLTEEQAEKAAKASAEELKSFIPKTRFDEVNESKKTLEADIKTRDGQLEALKKVDAEGLKATVEKLQADNKIAREKFDADLKKVQIDSAVDRTLVGAKAKNIKAVKALLDSEKFKLDGETVLGLDDQVKKLIEGEDTKFLFDSGTKEKSKDKEFKGLKPGEAGDKGNENNPTSLADAVKMHFAKQE
ncbi:MAG: phage scaffolding protein [Alkaliphilus sp.]